MRTFWRGSKGLFKVTPAFLTVALLLSFSAALVSSSQAGAREVPPVEPPIRCIVVPRVFKGKPALHPGNDLHPCIVIQKEKS